MGKHSLPQRLKSMSFEKKIIHFVDPFGTTPFENVLKNVNFSLLGKQCSFPKLHFLLSDFGSTVKVPRIFINRFAYILNTWPEFRTRIWNSAGDWLRNFILCSLCNIIVCKGNFFSRINNCVPKYGRKHNEFVISPYDKALTNQISMKCRYSFLTNF